MLIMILLFLSLIPSFLNGARTTKEKQGLIIVDIQYDFASPSGSLSVFLNDKNEYLNISSAEYVDRINTFIENERNRFDFIALSIDYHPTGHCSFATTMQTAGANVSIFQNLYPDDEVTMTKSWHSDICNTHTGYQTLWPDHCIRGTDGAKFMSDLYDIRPLPHLQSQDDLRRVVIWRNPDEDELYVTNYKLAGSTLMFENSSFKTEIDHVLEQQTTQITANVSQVMYVFKGRDLDIDSYSVFDGNDGATRTGLFDALNAYDYTPSNTDLTIFGIAYDYCVVFTCRDAVDHGYHVTIMDQMTAPVFPDAVPDLKTEMENIGMTINYTYGSVEVEEEDEILEEEDHHHHEEEEKHLFWMFIVIITVLVVIIIVLIIILIVMINKNKQRAGFEAPPEQKTETMHQQHDMERLNTTED